MKNITVYTGTIKKCLNHKKYKKDGDVTCSLVNHNGIIECRYMRNSRIIDDQAILIKTHSNHFYEFKLNHSFLDNIKIIFDIPQCAIQNKPTKDNDFFYIESTITPYYKEQPKILSLKKLKKDISKNTTIKN